MKVPFGWGGGLCVVEARARRGHTSLVRRSRSFLIAVLLLGCTPPENATRDAPRSAAPTPASNLAPTPTSAPPPTSPTSAVVVPPTPTPPPDEQVGEPELLDAQGQALPQLEDQPADDSRLFHAHVDQLIRAIVADDATIAEHVFFPRVAYEQVKAIEKPGLDWKNRLWKAFVRDVHEYHQELGADPDGAELVAIEVTGKKEWMKPGAEGNKLGYWRTKRAHLRVADARGKEHAFEVTSMISWRGEWYVVHLHGFD
jgi:hypothetical protein